MVSIFEEADRCEKGDAELFRISLARLIIPRAMNPFQRLTQTIETYYTRRFENEKDKGGSTSSH